MNEMAVNSSTYMYDEVSEINQLNKVEGFDPRKYMRLIQNEGQAGKYYLDVTLVSSEVSAGQDCKEADQADRKCCHCGSKGIPGPQ